MTGLFLIVIFAVAGVTTPRDVQDVPSTRRATTMPAADANTSVEKMLSRRMPNLQFEQVKLGDVIDFLRDLTGCGFETDWDALLRIGVTPQTPVTSRSEMIPLREVLDILADAASPSENKRMVWRVNDGKLFITADQEAAATQSTD